MTGELVTWNGVTEDRRTVAMLEAAGELHGHPISRAFQGGWRPVSSFSADTHVKAAIDCWCSCGRIDGGRDATGLPLVLALRMAGFAAWHRTPAQGDWEHHVHAVPGGGDLSDGARRQWFDYVAGGDGLGVLDGRTSHDDDGPRPWEPGPVPTWAGYLESELDDVNLSDKLFPDHDSSPTVRQALYRPYVVERKLERVIGLVRASLEDTDHLEQLARKLLAAGADNATADQLRAIAARSRARILSELEQLHADETEPSNPDTAGG